MNDLQKRQREEQLVDWNKEAQELYREMSVAYNYSAFLEGYIAGRKKGDEEIEAYKNRITLKLKPIEDYCRERPRGVHDFNKMLRMMNDISFDFKDEEIAQLKTDIKDINAGNDLALKYLNDMNEQLREELKQLNFNLDEFGGWLIETKCPSVVLDKYKRARSIQAQRKVEV